jgi:hypothetical protein
MVVFVPTRKDFLRVGLRPSSSSNRALAPVQRSHLQRICYANSDWEVNEQTVRRPVVPKAPPSYSRPPPPRPPPLPPVPIPPPPPFRQNYGGVRVQTKSFPRDLCWSLQVSVLSTKVTQGCCLNPHCRLTKALFSRMWLVNEQEARRPVMPESSPSYSRPPPPPPPPLLPVPIPPPPPPRLNDGGVRVQSHLLPRMCADLCSSAFYPRKQTSPLPQSPRICTNLFCSLIICSAPVCG